jgi:multiple antibiotic resistance protein
MFNVFLTAIPMSYAAIFAVLNPLGTAFLFLAMTQKLDSPTRRLVSRKIAINIFALLVAVVLVGGWVLRFFGISIPIVEVAGGLIVAAISWTLINESEDDQISGNKTIKTKEEALSKVFFPLTMPITAGPGSMAVTLALSAHEYNTGSDWRAPLAGEAGILTAILLIAITAYFCFAYADIITKKAGHNGTNIIMKLSAFINFCIGLSITWNGIQGLFHLS